MKIYAVQQDDKRLVMSNRSFKEGKVVAKKVDVTEKAYNNYKTMTKDLKLDGDKLIEIPSDRKVQKDAMDTAQQSAEASQVNKRKDLIAKITSGTATVSEQEEFLTLI